MENQISETNKKVIKFPAFVQIAGRVTIPYPIRESEGIQHGDLVEVELKVIKKAGDNKNGNNKRK